MPQFSEDFATNPPATRDGAISYEPGLPVWADYDWDVGGHTWVSGTGVAAAEIERSYPPYGSRIIEAEIEFVFSGTPSRNYSNFSVYFPGGGGGLTHDYYSEAEAENSTSVFIYQNGFDAVSTTLASQINTGLHTLKISNDGVNTSIYWDDVLITSLVIPDANTSLDPDLLDGRDVIGYSNFVQETGVQSIYIRGVRMTYELFGAAAFWTDLVNCHEVTT